MTTLNTNLTDNELNAAMTLVKSCLAGMGGKRPIDLDNDPFTWIDAKDLISKGWSKEAAAGTLGALEAKGFVQLDGRDSTLTTEAYRYLDTIWKE